MTLATALAALLALLEALGRVLYPLNRDARSKREARRDFRRSLTYLGAPGVAHAILRDIYRMEKRYLPFLGWVGGPDNRLATIETNSHGFRDNAIARRRQGECRILVTGGSFAWAFGASSNASTISAQLQRHFDHEAPGSPCRVMNAAFLNWSSRQEYVVITEFFDLFDPDLVISLTGYNDLVALSKAADLDAMPEAKMLGQAVADQLAPCGTLRAVRKLAGTLGVWRIVVLIREELAALRLPAHHSFGYDGTDASGRLERTVQRYLSIADFVRRKGRRYLIALEPDIYSTKKALTIEEFDLKTRFRQVDRGLEEPLMRYRQDLAARLASLASDRYCFLDLAAIFDRESDPVFIDYNHTCDRGYALVARALISDIRDIAFDHSGPSATSGTTAQGPLIPQSLRDIN